MRASPTTPPCSWPGGKTVFAEQIIDLLFGVGHSAAWDRMDCFSETTYFEPCCGMAAVALHVRDGGFPGRMVLTDLDPSVVNLWRVVKESPYEIAECLGRLAADTSEPEFYRLRDLQNADVQNPVEHAARMIYLSKRAHGGLFRRNGSGKFNVPVGHGKGVQFSPPTEEYFIALSDMLHNTVIARANGLDTISLAGRGDYVFADPPYADSHSYGDPNRWGFDKTAEVVRSLERAADRGAKCAMTEHDSPAIRGLLSSKWAIHPVEVSARIQRKVAGVDRPVRREIIAVIG